MKFSDLFSKPSDAHDHVVAGFDREKGVALVRLLREKGLTSKDVQAAIDIITDLQTDSFVAGGQFAIDRLETMAKEAH